MDIEEDPALLDKKDRTCAGLRLDLEAAAKGKTWLLLPEGFRDRECGSYYPLPSKRSELKKLIVIPIPCHRSDAGCRYLHRALKHWRKVNHVGVQTGIKLDVQRTLERTKQKSAALSQEMKAMREEARLAVDGVKREADQAIASLTDLFSLGRKGLEAQMQAHLNGEEWQGERINSRAFRQCFQMVTAAVKGLGLPSDQSRHATETIMEEAAKAIEATQETVGLSSGGEGEEPVN